MLRLGLGSAPVHSRVGNTKDVLPHCLLDETVDILPLVHRLWWGDWERRLWRIDGELVEVLGRRFCFLKDRALGLKGACPA